MNNIEEILEHRHESCFFDRLQEWIDSVPFCRAGAEKLLDLVMEWDILEVYEKLLTEYRGFLTNEEITKLETNYKRLFDTPLPGEWTWVSE